MSMPHGSQGINMKMIRIFFGFLGFLGFLGLLGFLGFLALFSSNASAQFTSPAFWKHSTPYLTFTNTTSTINARICSSSTTVQSTSSGGVPLDVGSLLTVNLSTTDAGMSFYSDPLCLTPITSITISAGTSTTASFYFMTTSLGLSSIGLTP